MEKIDPQTLPLRARMGAAQVYRRTKVDTGQPMGEVLDIFRRACADMGLDPAEVYRICQRAKLPGEGCAK